MLMLMNIERRCSADESIPKKVFFADIEIYDTMAKETFCIRMRRKRR